MIRHIRRLEIKQGVHLEGIGNLTSPLPMAMKNIPLQMYYNSAYPTLVFLKVRNVEHFISMDNVKSGTFDDEAEGNVL